MHSVLSNRAQSFATAFHDTFVAEIASTPREHLLFEHMLAHVGTDERLLSLGAAVENDRGTFFRQAMQLTRAGGSDDRFELVRRAGVDLADPAPYPALFTRMNGIMDRIEAILARRG